MSPTYSFFGDEEEAFQKLRSGFQSDVTHICGGSVNKWVESGILEPWDKSRIDGLADLDANLLGTDVDRGRRRPLLHPDRLGLDRRSSTT
jgi:spermidine/putrescine transport system substrate-binding protein